MEGAFLNMAESGDSAVGRAFARHQDAGESPSYEDSRHTPGTIKKTSTQKSAVDILEQAVLLLRNCPASLFLVYYMGSLPFFLAFLYFWGDMSRSAFAGAVLAPSSLGLALLFVWMKLWQSLFALKIHDRAAHIDRKRPSILTLFRLTAFQAGVQASGFILLPIALLATIPYGWAYAFYQNVLLHEPDDLVRPGSVIRRAMKNSAYAAKQNHMILLILFVFKLMVFMNMGTLIYTVPQLLKSFFGIETVFTLGGFSPMNSTFLTTVYVLTHLAVDPLVKIVYVMRCFYSESEKTGVDITAELKSIAGVVRPAALVLLLILVPVILNPSKTMAAPAQTPPWVKPAQQVMTKDARTLGESIKNVMERREYTWRMPVEKQIKPEKSGWFDAFLKWIEPYWDKCKNTLKRWWEAISNWLDKLFKNKKDQQEKKDETKSSFSTRYMLYGLLGLCAAFLGILLFQWLKTRKDIHEITAEPVDIRVDLTDETIKADDLPYSVWTTMSQDLMEKGEYRLALRALYLATLSRLAESGLITVQSYKSNREYVDELNRRAHEKKDLLFLFSDSVTVFDGAWYGRMQIERDDVIRFSENQERIYGHAV